MTTATWQIHPSRARKRSPRCAILLEEYWDSFGFTPCFQNFGDELAGLPGAYAPPGRPPRAGDQSAAKPPAASLCAAWMRAAPKPSAFTCARLFEGSGLAARCWSG